MALEMLLSYRMISCHATRHGLNSGAAFQLCHKGGRVSSFDEGLGLLLAIALLILKGLLWNGASQCCHLF